MDYSNSYILVNTKLEYPNVLVDSTTLEYSLAYLLKHIIQILTFVDHLDITLTKNKLNFDYMKLYKRNSLDDMIQDEYSFDINTFQLIGIFSIINIEQLQNHGIQRLIVSIKKYLNSNCKAPTRQNNIVTNKIVEKKDNLKSLTRNIDEIIKNYKPQKRLNKKHTVTYDDVPSETESDSNLDSKSKCYSYSESESETSDEFDDLSDSYVLDLKTKINALADIKIAEESKLNKLKEKKDNIETKYIDNKCELDSKKMEHRRLKEKEEERRRIFIHDRDFAYKKISEDILDENKKMTEESIPSMFAAKYSILKILDEDGFLGKDGDYEMYCQLYDELYKDKSEEIQPSQYLPHNIHYLSPEEQLKYKNVKPDDLLKNFVNKNRVPYESFEKIMADTHVSSDSDSNS